MQLIARRYDTQEIVEVELAGSYIGRIRPVEGSPPESLPYVSPALVDVQVNGYGGQEFSAGSLTPAHVRQITASMSPFGVGQYLPTVTTNSLEVLEHAGRMIAAACEADPSLARRIPGIHLEGPFISSEDGPRGAHPARHCRAPDWDFFSRLQDAAGGRIRLLTLSPEFEGTERFISRATTSGVVVAIGHTAATSEQIRAAVDAGARLSTHLGNGAHRSLPRHPNYIWDQLADDRLTASLIVDGHHLPAAVVKTFVRTKGPERCILVSDLSGLAGLPAGRYASELCDLEILHDGRLVIAGQQQLLAGASAPLGRGVATVMDFAGVTLRQAIDMASIQPAALLGLELPRLQDGAIADLMLFDLSNEAGRTELHVRSLIVGGEQVYVSST